MAFKFSTGLRVQQCFSASLKDLLDNSVIRLYTGQVPASPDDAITGQMLCEITANGNPVTFEAGGSIPLLTKNLSEIWQGDVLASGFVTHFRLVKQSDTGEFSRELVRVQGTVGGPSDDLTISNATLVEGAPQRIDYFAIELLEQA